MKIALNDEFFNRLESLSLMLNVSQNGYFGGKNVVRAYGQTVEFADFREYQFGDDIRRIDWNLYGRFEKHFLRLFTDERQMQTQIFLDCSGSMGKDQEQKARYAIVAAAAFGFLTVHNMDRLSLNFMRGDKAQNPFGTIVGKNAFYRAMGSLTECDFDGDVDIERCVTRCPDTGSGSGLTVIISDFLTESSWKKAVDYLTFKHRDVLLLQVMMPEELDPSYDGRMHLIDTETTVFDDPRNMKVRIGRKLLAAYAEALRNFLTDIDDFCKRRGATYISVSCDTPIERVLFGKLLQTGVVK